RPADVAASGKSDERPSINIVQTDIHQASSEFVNAIRTQAQDKKSLLATSIWKQLPKKKKNQNHFDEIKSLIASTVQEKLEALIVQVLKNGGDQGLRINRGVVHFDLSVEHKETMILITLSDQSQTILVSLQASLDAAMIKEAEERKEAERRAALPKIEFDWAPADWDFIGALKRQALGLSAEELKEAIERLFENFTFEQLPTVVYVNVRGKQLQVNVANDGVRDIRVLDPAFSGFPIVLFLATFKVVNVKALGQEKVDQLNKRMLPEYLSAALHEQGIKVSLSEKDQRFSALVFDVHGSPFKFTLAVPTDPEKFDFALIPHDVNSFYAFRKVCQPAFSKIGKFRVQIFPLGTEIIPWTASKSRSELRTNEWPSEWNPDGLSPEDWADGDAYHRVLYVDGNWRHPVEWHFKSVQPIIKQALPYIQDGDIVLDYGAGTGGSAIELLKVLKERGIKITLVLTDISPSWLATAWKILQDPELRGKSEVKFYMLWDVQANSFKPLSNVFGSRKTKVIIAANVPHLIPEVFMDETFQNFENVLDQKGALVWSSGDIALNDGALPMNAVLAHDILRDVRRTALKLIDEDERFVHLRKSLDRKARRLAARRADRLILPNPHTIGMIEEKFKKVGFTGDVTHGDIIFPEGVAKELLLVPRMYDYLGEFGNSNGRGALIEEIMREHISPSLHNAGAKTTDGIRTFWTFGKYVLNSSHNLISSQESPRSELRGNLAKTVARSINEAHHHLENDRRALISIAQKMQAALAAVASKGQLSERIDQERIPIDESLKLLMGADGVKGEIENWLRDLRIEGSGLPLNLDSVRVKIGVIRDRIALVQENLGKVLKALAEQEEAPTGKTFETDRWKDPELRPYLSRANGWVRTYLTEIKLAQGNGANVPDSVILDRAVDLTLFKDLKAGRSQIFELQPNDQNQRRFGSPPAASNPSKPFSKKPLRPSVPFFEPGRFRKIQAITFSSLQEGDPVLIDFEIVNGHRHFVRALLSEDNRDAVNSHIRLTLEGLQGLVALPQVPSQRLAGSDFILYQGSRIVLSDPSSEKQVTITFVKDASTSIELQIATNFPTYLLEWDQLVPPEQS
ncbi:MAG: hypothetical protein HY582_01655, partial [Candidatus Omnitrophica bacterium]|nr:hypothetical protein [Candidatus Omnitrophota bacterium]